MRIKYLAFVLLNLGCSESDLSQFNNDYYIDLTSTKENDVADAKIKNQDDLNDFTSSVIGVLDGDTIELLLVSDDKNAKQRIGKNLRIRFAHIDCPEKGRPYYKLAKQFTSDLCYGKEVKIVHDNEYDRYGRLIGEVILSDGQNLNKLLVSNGLALHFKKYSNSEDYSTLEEIAQSDKIGIWSGNF